MKEWMDVIWPVSKAELPQLRGVGVVVGAEKPKEEIMGDAWALSLLMEWMTCPQLEQGTEGKG